LKPVGEILQDVLSASKKSMVFTALAVFLILRIWFSLLGILAVTVRPLTVEPQNAHDHAVMAQLDSTTFQRLFLSPWYRFDTVHYLEIAENGYLPNDHNSAFAPLFPALIWLVDRIIPSAMGSAMIVSNLAAFICLWLFLGYVRDQRGEVIAKNSIFWLAAFPSTFILFQPYTESLFFALMLSCLLAVERNRWGWAAIFAGLATLARFQGVLLVIVFLWKGFDAVRHQGKLSFSSEWITPLAAAVVPVICLVGYLLGLKFYLNGILPWEALASGWGERFGWPWEGIIGTIRSLLLNPPKELILGLLMNLASAILVPIILILYRKKTPVGLQLLFWVLYFVAVTKVTPVGDLHSAFRYMIPILTIYVFLGEVLVKKWQRLTALAISLPLQAGLLVMFYMWIWVF